MANLSADALADRFVDIGREHAPQKLGVRFGADGQFRSIPGNTIIRHVPSGSRTMQLLTEAQAELKAASHASHFTFMPTPSFHMTVFEGVIDDRRQKDYWPSGVSYSAPIETTTQMFIERLGDFASPGPFSMKINAITPLGLRLEGVTTEDETIARAWRDALTAPLGYRDPNHDAYGFHITFAYLVEWLPPEAVPLYLDLLDGILSRLQAELPVIELNPPALCSFGPLTHFDELLVLGD